MSQFLTDLDVRLVDDFAGLWQLRDQLIYRSDILGRDVTVPKGFVTDFASGPSLFWVSLARDQGRKAATLHDYAYSSRFVDRATADDLLREALIASGYSAATAGIYHAAVRIFGGSHWKADNNPQPAEVDAAMQALAAVAKAGA